jgi:hypothetical protein
VSDWDAERDRVYGAIAEAVRELRDDMLLSSVVIAVTVNQDGEKTISCWPSPDQRHWETIGLLEYVRMDHGAFLAERRLGDGGES